jgi:rhodanese-related sulfurtransferase
VATFQDLFSQAKARVDEIDAQTAADLGRSGDAKIVDVREKSEWDEGHIPGAVHVPRGYLELRIENSVPDKSQPVILYCAGGTRSVLAARTLQDMGYTNVTSVGGGFGATF